MPSYWTTYLASDDVDDTAAKIRDAGGTVFMDPFDVFDSGRMTVAQDPTGAAFGVWQAKEHIGAELANEPARCSGTSATRPTPRARPSSTSPSSATRSTRSTWAASSRSACSRSTGRGIGGVREPVAGEPPSWSVTFAVADADETVSRAKELGGTVLMEPFDLPEIGRLAVIQDPAGAVFQVMKSAGPPPEPPA